MCRISVIFCALLVLTLAQNPDCNEDQFQCDDRTCIQSALKCNGAVDCPDGSDEQFVICTTNDCERDQFQCAYGACVKSNATCDGIKDCADNSDELLLKCRNEMTSTECLIQVVLDQEDMVFIPRPGESIAKCEVLDRTCKDGQIIQGLKKCNGKVNCKDGSDETLETCASETCLRGFFRCKYGACLHPSKRCNGVKDCADGSDELDVLCHTDNKGLCVLPEFPKHGYYSTVELTNSYPGQAVESVHFNYSCHSGYKLVGTQSLYCNKGWWSDTAPKCVPQCQLNKHPSVTYLCLPKNSNSEEGAKECDDLVEDGTAVRPQCREPNFYYSGVLVNMHCTDGVWDHVTVCSPQCGLVTAEGVDLVIGGRAARRGELPWHTGIYKKTTTPYMQICGGSLVSNSVVISAAHCFWSELEGQLPASNFAVAVGKLYRPWNDPHDKDAQKSDVREIKIPALFQGAKANFQEDIAILILTSPIEFRPYVRPVCVDFDYNFSRQQLSVGAAGKVAGWGFAAEDGAASQVLRTVDLPYVDIQQCISSSPPGFIQHITSDKICAGVITGTARTVCKGDSGGGLSFAARERGAERYFLRGVVSTAPTNEHLCNAHVYTTFTKITKHEEFIKEYLA